MSEAPAAETTKKKKSPLPVVVALVLVLGGGGFFMTQGKGEKKEEKSPVIKLAHEEVELEDEFLVNMADRTTYLRAKISFKTAEDFDAHGMEASKGAVDDAIIGVLRTTRPEDVMTAEQMQKLKRRLADAMNKVLGAAHGEEGHSEGHGKVTEIRRKVEEEELPPDWASNEGPVLQIFFRSFAMQ